MLVMSASLANNRLAALFGIVTLSSFHIARIGTSVLSNSASFKMITFCRIDGAPDLLTREGGPKGGNGEDDIGALVGLVIADEPLDP